MNRKVHVACNFNYLFENEALLKVTDSHVHNNTSVFGEWRISTHADPIRQHAARSCVREPKGNRCECRGGGGTLADSSDFGLLGSKVHKMGDSICLGLRWTALQNLTPLALASAYQHVWIINVVIIYIGNGWGLGARVIVVTRPTDHYRKCCMASTHMSRYLFSALHLVAVVTNVNFVCL